MKRLIIAISATLFTAAAGAADDSAVYHGFADGNPDLSTAGQTTSVSAMRPGVGDHYQGWGEGISDLFAGADGGSDSSGNSDIYHGFADDNPDLH